MAFKSATQPLCRFCGKRIPKHTTRVYFGRRFGADSDWSRSIPDHKPADRAAAQRLVNEQIVSTKWDWPKKIAAADYFDSGEDHEPNFISEVTVWDGESYQDEFFCNGDHAQRFGYAAARWEDGRLAMPAYREAIAVRSAISASNTAAKPSRAPGGPVQIGTTKED